MPRNWRLFRWRWKRLPERIDSSAGEPKQTTCPCRGGQGWRSAKKFWNRLRGDPNGFERIIGASDLMSINFLDRGWRAAAAVCRIKVPSDGGAWYGAGFLVGPPLLLTNHHVFGNADEASQSEAEFGYEHDLDGVLREPVRYNLRPHEIFYTNPELDVTFVAVTPLSDEGVPLDRYVCRCSRFLGRRLTGSG